MDAFLSDIASKTPTLKRRWSGRPSPGLHVVVDGRAVILERAHEAARHGPVVRELLGRLLVHAGPPAGRLDDLAQGVLADDAVRGALDVLVHVPVGLAGLVDVRVLEAPRSGTCHSLNAARWIQRWCLLSMSASSAVMAR